MSYTDFLCPADGTPALWPSPPRWQTDAAFRQQLVAEVAALGSINPRGYELLIATAVQQRDHDDRWRRFNQLRDTFPATETRTSREWAEALLVPTGWEPGPLASPSANGGRPLTANAFGIAHGQHMRPSAGYTPPPVPPP